MSALPWRIALATLALMIGVVVCADALVLSFGTDVSIPRLWWPTLALFGLAVCAAGFAFAHSRELVRELQLLCTELRAPSARPSHVPEVRFRESHLLRGELSAILSALRSAEAARDAEREKTDAPLALRIRFVAAMGHDLRTPLNAMLGFADLLAVDRNATWNAQQTKSLSIMRDRTRDLLGLIDDMIDWAKLESGELVLSPKPCSPMALIELAIDAAKQRSGARGLRTRVELAPGLPRVRVDEARVVHALLGLMDHAARSEGAPELVVRAAFVHSAGRGDHVKLEVFDPQLELRPGDRDQLFRAFRPSFAPSGRRIGGLSLGTAMARALLRAQGGDVWFEGRPERGTTFVVAMPLANQTPESSS